MALFAMRILTLSTSPHIDRSFQIGVAVVVLFAVAEFSTASYYYLRRFSGSSPAVAAQTSAPAPKVTPFPKTRITPRPAPPVASPSAPAIPETDRLIQQGVAARSKGDMVTALARLHEAEGREPKNPKVLEEMAKTYDQQQFFTQANETWRKIQQLGPAAGASYDLAVTRLKTGVPSPAPATAPSVAPLARAATSPPPPAATEASPSAPISGSLFSIAQVKATEEPDPDAETNLTLRIGIKKQPNAVVDHTKVKIQVFFYDLVNDKEVKLTDADVNPEWETPNHDWAGTEPEVLRVNYLRQKNRLASSDAALAAAAASINPGRKAKPANPPAAPEGGKRVYFGYIVRVYYHDHLQAESASPKRLLKLYPASSPAQ